MTQVQPPPYRWLAEFYDHLFENRRSFTRARRAVWGPLLPQVHAACDLACGTGDLALWFAERAIRTYAVDLSPEMCRITRRKAKAAALPVTVIEADTREFVLPAPVDLVTCEFDALNHVPRRTDLGRVLRRVKAALVAGGHFAFDVNHEICFRHTWTRTWFVDHPPVAAVMQGSYRSGSQRARIGIDWFVQRGRSWQRYQEEVEEVCWSRAELARELRAAGFAVVRRWDAAPFLRDGITRPGFRSFWLARKRS